MRRSPSLAVSTLVAVSLAASPLASQNKLVFVTSVSGPGDLGDPLQWPDNGGLAGLEAADAVCRARAAAGGLANPQDFVAWLSDSSDDAYCRIHGLTGTKAARCGQATLPASAGPWVRLDEYAFAERIDRALAPDGRVYTPVAFDEFGEDARRAYFTGTDEDGVLAAGDSACADWSSGASTPVTVGAPNGTTDAWSGAGGDSCISSLHLLCLEGGGAGTALPSFERYGAAAFLTSARGSGNLSSWPDAGGSQGLAAGDAICRARAGAAGLDQPQSFVAWLSDGSSDAADRITTDGPWVRLDGVPVASRKSDLTVRNLFSSIHLTEEGQYVADFALTGTDISGVSSGNDCDGWTDGASGTATAGRSAYTASAWTLAWNGLSCALGGHLYCFSDTTCWKNAPLLCLDQERFTIEVAWEDFSGNSGEGRAIPLTSDTGYFWFFNESNVELILKVLDGTAINGHYWVYYGALSNVEYEITVTDDQTGSSVSYHNPAGNFASVGDTEALPGAALGNVVGRRRVEAPITALDSRTGRMYTELMQLGPEDSRTATQGDCVGDGTTLCLNDDRFALEVEWQDFSGNSGEGTPVPLTDDTGYFWFFRDTNVELVVKVLDGRPINDHFWVYYGALSNVQYTITVTDTITDTAKSYSNLPGNFGSVGDPTAFYVP